MYMVVSRWNLKAGNEEQFEIRGKAVRQALRQIPGVTLCEAFRTGDHAIAVLGYADEAAYKQITQDPNGPFEKLIAEQGLEEVSEWVWSERGETQN